MPGSRSQHLNPVGAQVIDLEKARISYRDWITSAPEDEMPGWFPVMECGSAARVVSSGGTLSPYLTFRLAEHVAAAGMWSTLGDRLEVLDMLDPDAVAMEAFRTGQGGGLPPGVLTSMVARDQLRNVSQAARRLTRALAANRLGLADPALTDPHLRWAHLQRVHPTYRPDRAWL